MSAGIPRFVTVNLQQLNTKFQDGEQVDLDTLQQKGLLNLSGREASLPLKVCFATHSCTCSLVLQTLQQRGLKEPIRKGKGHVLTGFQVIATPSHCNALVLTLATNEAHALHAALHHWHVNAYNFLLHTLMCYEALRDC